MKCPTCGSTNYSLLTLFYKGGPEVRCSDCGHEGTYEAFTQIAFNKGDRITFNDTETTRRFGIAGGTGFVEHVSGDDIFAIYTDRIFGPSGPYQLTSGDVEKTTSSRKGTDRR